MNELNHQGSLAWVGLSSYVVLYDIWAMFSGKETLSSAFERAIQAPKKRWLVTASWLLTTKHLFFKDIVPWLDPFAVLALGVKAMQKALHKEL